MAWKKIFALMAAFLLFCCACGEKTPVSDPALQKQQQALRIFCPEEEYTDLSDALAAFRSKNPQLTVDLVRFDSVQEMEDQLVAQLNTGSGPDIVIFNHSHRPGRAKNGPVRSVSGFGAPICRRTPPTGRRTICRRR